MSDKYRGYVGFRVNVYVEGYRPNKETWKYHVEDFPTLAEASSYVEKLDFMNWDERNNFLNFKDEEKWSGAYSLSYEGCKIFQYDKFGNVTEVSDTEDQVDEDLSMGEILERFKDRESLHRTEGEAGVRNLEMLCNALGYRDNGLRYGSAIENFLSDNPGAIEALWRFVEEVDLEEWREALQEEQDA